MRIQRGKNYTIDLFEEPKNVSNHKRTAAVTGPLTFTGAELIEAIVSAGMPDVYLRKSERIKRKEEIDFKIKLFETFVASSKGGRLSFDASRKKYLDSSEIAAIDYWLGMMLTTLLGQKKYNFKFLVHLSKVDQFSSKIFTKRHAFLPADSKIVPDLLAVGGSSKKRYGVFESKGYSRYSKKAMEHAWDQARSIDTVNGNPPTPKLAVMTVTGEKEIFIIEKDPDCEGCKLEVDLDIIYLYHLLPIAELINELEHEEKGDRMCGSLDFGDGQYSISIPSVLFRELFKIIESDQESFQDDPVFESFFGKLHSAEEAGKEILLVE